jgi:hypothetical protein
MTNIDPKQILKSGPSGWDYSLWHTSIGENSVQNWSEKIGVSEKIDQDLISEGDEVEIVKEFIFTIIELSNLHGFTHIKDSEEDGIETIFEAVLRIFKNFDGEKRFLEGMDDNFKNQIITAYQN